MKICACNNCGHLYNDTNPQLNATEYAAIDISSLGFLRDKEVEANDINGNQWFHGCPVCLTDDYLTDDIRYWANRLANKEIIETAIIGYERIPEYQEEDTTAWSKLENLRNLLYKE